MNLYCKLPFGQFDHRNPIVIKVSEKLERTPSSLAMKLSNLASLDPLQQARGIKGLSGASKADRRIWEEFTENWEKLGTESEERFQELIGLNFNDFNQDLADKKPNTSDLGPLSTSNKIEEKTEIQATVKIRIGQTFFRQMVLSSYENRCCITDNPIPELLIASHIIPWREQSGYRLNPENGLCLARTHDAAFDQGLITFDGSNKLLLSRRLQDFLPEETLERNFIAYANKQLRLPKKFQPNSEFIRFHRENIFLGA
ncbi:MAG: HNH endonuclease [Leptolyngbyaceae cyanobacterium]